MLLYTKVDISTYRTWVIFELIIPPKYFSDTLKNVAKKFLKHSIMAIFTAIMEPADIINQL